MRRCSSKHFPYTSLNSPDAIPSGALIYVAPDGTRKTIASDGLLFPTALALGSDGDIYVLNNGYLSGQGEVVRISVPEPSYGASLLASFWYFHYGYAIVTQTKIK